MASFFNTLLFTFLFSPIKYIPYISLIFKFKIKSKAKFKAKPKIIKSNFGEVSAPKYYKKWADINDFLTNLLDFKASRFLNLGLLALIKTINSLNLLY